ncbi:MAG: response regulator transcription factor [Chloroflexota bacterium]|nr:MAG: response regulator transcription factor [Chloroflexota bacterium]
METILVVEENVQVRAMIQDFLSAQGYFIVAANNGETPLEIAERVKPKLVLCDVTPPRSNGFQFLSAFRRISNAPVILTSASTEEADKVIGLELGADDFMTKPFALRELLARIRSHLRRA